jgi:hypothetical protein
VDWRGGLRGDACVRVAEGGVAAPCSPREPSSLGSPMVREGQENRLEVSDRCLVVFVDDTGHEDFAVGHPVYGLGGCAALGRDLERLIEWPWKEVRRRVNGSPDAQLHANKFARTAKTEDMQAVASFFREPFWRFGAVLTKETQSNLPDEMGRVRVMKGALQERIQEIVQMTLCKEVKVIFEASDRTDKFIQEAFLDFTVHRGTKYIPSECYLMPKSAASPAMEVADFIMHAVGRQARHNLMQRGNFLADFCAVFHAVDPNLTSFREIGAVIRVL